MLALLPAIALIVTGCGTSTSNTTSTPKVVRVLAVAGPETDALIKHAPEFEKATGITASIEQVARPLWGQRKVRELIERAGLYDVVMVGGGDDNTWVKYKAHVKDLSKVLPADQLSQVNLLDKFKINDKIVGIPQYYNFPMLFYRKDLFENPAEQAAFKAKYGRDLTAPTSYDEMYQVAQFFNRPPNLYGFFIGGQDWSIYLDDTYFVYGLGGNYGDLSTKQLTLNTPEQKQPLVGKAAHLGAFVATIPDAAPSPEAGAKFIQWMMGATYQKEQALETGDLPIRKDVMQDPDVRKALVGIDQFEKVLPNLQYNQTTWVGELSAGVTEAIFKVVKDHVSPDVAADWLQNEKFKGRKAIEWVNAARHRISRSLTMRAMRQ